jgi:hypothetical protein
MHTVNETNPSTDLETLQRCYTSYHPDAKRWLPHTPGAHMSLWARMEVEDVYYVGGFGEWVLVLAFVRGVYDAERPGGGCRCRTNGELTGIDLWSFESSSFFFIFPRHSFRRYLAHTPALLGMEDSLHYIGHIPLDMVHLDLDTAAVWFIRSSWDILVERIEGRSGGIEEDASGRIFVAQSDFAVRVGCIDKVYSPCCSALVFTSQTDGSCSP